MKNFKLKLILICIYIMSAFVCFGQTCDNTPCYNFGSLDSYQEWNEMYEITLLLPSVNPDSCDLTPCYSFQSLDNYQKWKQLRLIQLGISTLTNSPSGSTTVTPNEVAYGSVTGSITSSRDFKVNSDLIDCSVTLNSSQGAGVTSFNLDSTGYTGISTSVATAILDVNGENIINLNVSTGTSPITGLNIVSTGGVGIGVSGSSTTRLNLGAGITTKSPLRIPSGTLTSVPALGNVEAAADKLYWTIQTGTARKEITLNDAALTSGRIPFTTTNGRLTDDGKLKFDPTLSAGLVSRMTVTATNQSEIYFTNGFGTTMLEHASNDFFITSSDIIALREGGGNEKLRISSVGTTLSDDLTFNTVGDGIALRTGSNARVGTATMVSGTITVSNTGITANSLIFVTGINSGASATWGELSVTKAVGTNFTITSNNVSDSRDIMYFIIEGN